MPCVVASPVYNVFILFCSALAVPVGSVKFCAKYYTNGVLNRLYSLYSRIYFLYSRIFNTPVKVIKSMTTRNLLYNSQTAGIEVQLLKFIDTKEIYFVQYGPCTNGAFDFW